MNPRLTRIRKVMREQNLDAVLISSIPNIIYFTNFNHFYPEEREAFLVITQKNNYILTDKRYTHAVQTHVKDFILCEIFYMHGFADWIKKISSEEKIQTLGIEENNLTVKEGKMITPHLTKVQPFDTTTLRITKSLKELATIQKACDIGDEAFAHTLTQLQNGMTEQEIAFIMEQFIKKQHAELAFASIVASGENGAFIHHKTGKRKLKIGDALLFDFGAKYENYCSDMSRTIFFGKASSEQKRVYQTVRKAQEKALAFLEKKLRDNEEIQGAAVDKVARDYIVKQGFPSFPHALGHGIGLEVHEPPFLRPTSTSVMTSGMVFSLEPGIYLPNKFGVRIEDLFVIKKNKLVQLTNASRDIIEI